MDIKEFTEKVAEVLKKRYKDLIVDASNDIKKNNDVTLSAISIHRKNSIVSPIIYTNGFFDGGYTIEEAAEEIARAYESHKDDMQDLNATDFLDFDKVKDKIIARVINKERNKNLLDAHPYAEFGDLAIIFSILVVQDKEKGLASIKINNDSMNNWKVNINKLIKYAYKNTKTLLPMEIENMKTFLKDMAKKHGLENSMATIDDFDVDMYIVTNKARSNGSYFITDRESLIEVAQYINSDEFYILPSSIHEFIVIPNNEDAKNEDELLTMVKEVNAKELAPDEILADNVYVFNAKSEELRTIEGTVIPFVA